MGQILCVQNITFQEVLHFISFSFTKKHSGTLTVHYTIILKKREIFPAVLVRKWPHVSKALLSEFLSAKKRNRPLSRELGLEHMKNSSPVIASQLTSSILSTQFQVIDCFLVLHKLSCYCSHVTTANTDNLFNVDGYPLPERGRLTETFCRGSFPLPSSGTKQRTSADSGMDE